MTLKERVSNVVTDVRGHWKRPAPGNYISYKEIANYSIGGFGGGLVATLTSWLGLSAGNLFIGSLMGMQPMHLQYMNMIMSVVGALFSIFRGKIVDNTRTRWGRFRPYIALAGIPHVAIVAIFLCLPVARFDYATKVFICMIFALSSSFIGAFFGESYNELRSVMSPNSNERAKLITIQLIVYSMAPTLTNLFIPMLVNIFPGGYLNQETYKWIMIPIGILGLGLSMFAAFGCKERTIVSKQFKPKVKTFKGIFQIWKNKYFWIRNIHGWLSFLEGAIGSIFTWIFIYQMQNTYYLGMVNTINGTASLICMLLTPFLIKRIGSKKILIGVNISNIFLIALMSMSFKVPLIFFLFNYINLFMGSFYQIVDPVMHSEVKDYTQYQTGQRMDFMFGAAGVIGLPITLLTGLAVPAIYEAFGLTNNYDVLFDPRIRENLFSTLCWISVFGAFINLLPLFFYDFTEDKHRNIIKVLQVRALFEDYSNNDLTPENIKTTIERVEEAKKYSVTEKPDVKALQAELKKLRSELPKSTEAEKKARHTKLKEARKSLYDAKNLIKEIDSSHILLDEMKKFDTEEWIRKCTLAEEIVAMGLPGIQQLHKTHPDLIEKAKALPKSNTAADVTGDKEAKKEAKLVDKAKNRTRKYEIKHAKQLMKLNKKANKLYPEGMQVVTSEAFDNAKLLPDGTKEEKKEKFLKLRAEEKKLNTYMDIAEVYENDKKLLVQRESYNSYEKIFAMYDEAVVQAEENRRLEDERNAAEDAAKKAELERLRKIRFDKMSPQKQQKYLEKQKLNEEKAAKKAEEKALKAAEESDDGGEN